MAEKAEAFKKVTLKESEMEFSNRMIDQVREIYEDAKTTALLKREEADEAVQTERVWANFREYVSKGWSMHFLMLLEREAARFKQLRAMNHSIIPLVEDVFRAAKEDCDRIFRRYPAVLENSCKKSGLKLDSISRHPRYSFESGFFRLEIDEVKKLARLSDYEGLLIELPADVEAVVEAVKKEYKRIFGRPFNAAKFLKFLRNQYKSVISKENLSDGSSVPIRHITRRLGKNVKGFRTDEFLLDLSRLSEQGPFEIDGRRLDLQQTKDTNQGMLLHGASSRGYVGFVLFKEA